MRSIYKFELGVDGEIASISAPIVKWLNIGRDGKGNICIWAIVNPIMPNENFKVVALGTGWQLEDKLEDPKYTYLGTIQDVPFVWHYFVMSESNESFNFGV